MTTNQQSDDQVHTFALGEVIDISEVNSLYDALKLLLNEASHVIVDASNVKRLDTAAFQLICSWYRETQTRNITVTWKNTDGVFRDSSDLLGVSSILSLE